MIEKIWADWIVSGHKIMGDVPAFYQTQVIQKLREYVEAGRITAEQFKALTSLEY